MHEEWRQRQWLVASSDTAWRGLVLLLAAALVVVLLVGLSVVVLPLLFGLFLATVLTPLSSRLIARGWKPALAAGATLALTIVIFALVIWLVVRAVIGPWHDIAAQVTKGLDNLQDRIARDAGDNASATATTARSGGGALFDILLRGVVSVAGAAITIVSTILLSLLVVYYYMKDGPTMWRWALDLTGPKAELVDRVGRVAWEKACGFMRGTALVATVDAIGIGLGALVLGVPFAGAIAIITFLFAFIPYYGAVVAGAIACLIALAENGLANAVAMLIVVVAVQQLEANVLQPVVIGRSVRLHPLVVALGVVAGGVIAGVLGMFLSVPLTAAATGAIAEMRAAGVFSERRARRAREREAEAEAEAGTDA